MIVQPKLETTVKREAVARALPSASSSSSSSLADSKRPLPQSFPLNREDSDTSGGNSDREEKEENDVFADQMESPLATQDSYDDDVLSYDRGRDPHAGPQAQAQAAVNE